MNLTCWIIYNGSLQSEKFIDYANMLKNAAKKRGHHVSLYKNNELLSLLETDKPQLLSNDSLNLPHYIIFTDKDIYLAKQLEQLGIRLFNRASTIEISDNKILTYQTLAAHHITIPKTIIAPKTFTNEQFISDEKLEKIGHTLSFPLVIKEAFGSFGEQVYLVNTFVEMKEKIAKLKSLPFVFQEFIDSSYGIDLRLQVVGDQVITAMKRTAKDDFRANVTAGGVMEAYEPTKYEKKLAIQAAKALNADFAGIDLLFGPDGEP